jgi:hypothetical protein
MEWDITVDLTNAQSWARDVTTVINHEGAQRPTFNRARQNVVTTAVLLDTMPAPFDDGVDKLYLQLTDILGISAT